MPEKLAPDNPQDQHCRQPGDVVLKDGAGQYLQAEQVKDKEPGKPAKDKGPEAPHPPVSVTFFFAAMLISTICFGCLVLLALYVEGFPRDWFFKAIIFYCFCSFIIIFSLATFVWSSVRINAVFSLVRKSKHAYILKMHFFAWKTLAKSANPGITLKRAANHALGVAMTLNPLGTVEIITRLVSPHSTSRHSAIPPSGSRELKGWENFLTRLTSEVARLMHDFSKRRQVNGKTRRRFRSRHPLFTRWYKYTWKFLQ